MLNNMKLNEMFNTKIVLLKMAQSFSQIACDSFLILGKMSMNLTQKNL